MREVLFRGRDVSTYKWVYGFLIKGKYEPETASEEYFITDGREEAFGWENFMVDPDTVGQWTGLYDKNGVRIFEGDIVLIPAYGGGKWRTVVYFENGKFAVNGSNYWFKDISASKPEVVGNIHDNPDMIPKSQ